MSGCSRATVSREVVLKPGTGGWERIRVRPCPPGRGLVFRQDGHGRTLAATLDRARVDGGVLVIAEGTFVMRGTVPILAACAAAGISDADIECFGTATQEAGALFDTLRATLGAAAVDLFAEPQTPLCPAAPVLVRDGRGMVMLSADTDTDTGAVGGRAAVRPRAGEVVLAPGAGIASLPFGPAWRLSIDLLALRALLGAPLAAVVRARHASLELLHAAICRAAAGPTRDAPVAGLRRHVGPLVDGPLVHWPEQQSLPTRIAHLL